MGRVVCLFLSNALRIAATCPSIIADGATISTPALAWLTAISPSNSNVRSLSIWLSEITPQCPWLVNSHKHMSPITTNSGVCCFIVLIACWTIPSALYASVPWSSFCDGIPNNKTAGMPRLCTSLTSVTSISKENWCMPGIGSISFFTPWPYVTNIG